MTNEEFISACEAVGVIEPRKAPKVPEAIVALERCVTNTRDPDTKPFLVWLRALEPAGPYEGALRQLQMRLPKPVAASPPPAPRSAPPRRAEESAR